ncbi:glutathione S-transferase, partial [Pseudomonas sp. HMWF007]
GLSVNRWFETPLGHPDYPAVRTYYERLSQREGFRLYGRNGTP